MATGTTRTTFMAAGRIAEKVGKAKWEKLVQNASARRWEMKSVYLTRAGDIPKDADRAYRL